MSKLIEIFVLLTNNDMAIMKASGMSEESIKLMCIKASDRVIADKLNDIQKEVFDEQIKAINSKMFKNNEEATNDWMINEAFNTTEDDSENEAG